MLRLLLLSALVLGLAAADGYEDDGLPRLGVRTIPVPLGLQGQIGTQPGQGTMVVRVRPGSPAAEMGLQPGDVIVSLNGSSIDSRRDLRAEVRSGSPGDAVLVGVLRPEGPLLLDGVLGERPARRRPPRPLPTEDWEQAVVARQQRILAERAGDLAIRERAIAAGEAAQAVARGESAALATMPELHLSGSQGWRFQFAFDSANPSPSRGGQ